MLSSPDAVCYATGHPIPIGTGPSPFTGGPALAFVGRQEGGGIVCANVEAGGLLASLPAEVYAGFAGLVTDQFAGYRAAVTRMIRQLGVGGKLAVQQASHPFSVADLLPRAMTLDVALDRIRAVKTAREISALRQAAKVASAGQLATRRLSLVGASELGVLNFVRAVMEILAGERCALAGQYLGGIEHTATLVTPPEPRLLLPGDPVICDLALGCGLLGRQLWQLCSCHAHRRLGCGCPGAHETLALAIATLRPRLTVGAFDATLPAHMAGAELSYPHHSGHDIGTSVPE